MDFRNQLPYAAATQQPLVPPENGGMSTDSHTAPSQPLLSHRQAAPFQSAYDITQQILESASSHLGSTLATPSPLVLPNATAAVEPHHAAVEEQKRHRDPEDRQLLSEFDWYPAATNGSPLVSDAADSQLDTATTSMASSSSPASSDGDAAAPLGTEQPVLPSLAAQVPGAGDITHDPLDRPASRSPSTSTKNDVSHRTSAVEISSEVASTRRPPRVVLKRKRASGEEDLVTGDAAETTQLSAEHRAAANGERRMSIITISDTSSPPSSQDSRVIVPAPTMAEKPSLANFYRKRTGQVAAAASKSASPAALPASASDIAPPPPDDPGSPVNAIARIRVTRPTILPPPKRAKVSTDMRTSHVPGTPFTHSLSGRPYDMFPNEKGRYVHGFGALFPDGYEPLADPDGKGPRWVCPVKHCTHERTYLKSHAKHFRKNHKACLLNDDGDGTFTVVGYDKNQTTPVVVSRDLKTKAAKKATSNAVMTKTQVPKGSKDVHSAISAKQTVNGDPATVAGNSNKPLVLAPSGRRYTVYPGHGGRSFGIPIPDDYERLVTSETKPWVCPIVPCLSSCLSQSGLSIHFGKKHGGTLLNDNLDGTLSVVGRRDDDPRFRSVPGWDQKDALVVSQGPMGSVNKLELRTRTADQVQGGKVAPHSAIEHDVTPASKSSLPTTSDLVHTPSSQLRNHYLTPAANAQPAKNLQGAALETWNYIRPFLKEFKECPDSSWIPDLLKLPKVRDIIWNDDYIRTHGFVDKLSRDVATMVLQVTGEAPPRICSKCREGKGPYGECIVISPEAPIDARLAFGACASCIYKGQGTSCTTKFWGKQRALDAAAQLRKLPAARQVGADTGETETPLRNVSQTQSSVRRSERVQHKESATERVVDNPPGTVATAATGDAKSKKPDDVVPSSVSHTPVPAPAQTRVTRPLNRVSEPSRPSLQPSNTAHMEIEEWELAPGRLQSAAVPEDGDLPETIAFSQPYLTANQSVPAAQDTTFRVEVVSPGMSVRFAATPERVRICSVGAGKLKVRMQGENEFHVGPHAMFRVLKDRSCVVLNRLYGDAVLHVTEVPDYS